MLWVCCALGSVVQLALEQEAAACGGMFCDGGTTPGPPPPSMRVDQTGETILFAWGDGFVEAHIQISYDGNEASEFAWIVPVLAVPEVEVGSARLFQAVLDSTQPIYGRDASSSCGGGDASSGAPSGVGFISFPEPEPSGDPPAPPPQALVRDVVGAFDYVVLDGGTAESVTAWLGENGYAGAEEAPAILDQYLDEGFVFVAFKLRQIAGVADLHPIVLRYPGDEPCVPLRLTRVAAVDDMPIRVLAFSDARALPASWRHVQLNRTRLDWVDVGANYDELVTRAIDAPGSDGRGFITEYSGSRGIVDRTVMTLGGLDAAAFDGIGVTEVYDLLNAQNLAACGTSRCSWGHELVPSLLHEFLPVPEGVRESEFYACLSCYVDSIDVAAWDPQAFATAYEQRIVAPLRNANELLDRWPVLTRLFTRVSPHEMITDPTFVRVPDAATVPLAYWAETQGDCCTAVRLPGGRVVELDPDGSWPQWDDEMPWAERIEELLPGGTPLGELVNHSEAIDAIVARRSAEVGCNASSGADSSETRHGASDDDGHGSGVDPSGGCGCRTISRPGSTLTLAGIVASACVRRRRRG